jgi:hypothetical protein
MRSAFIFDPLRIQRQVPVSVFLLVGFLLIGLLSFPLVARAVVQDELLAEAEQATRAKRAKLYLRLSERSLNEAKTEYDNGNSDQGRASLQKFMEYAREAFRTAKESGKHLKQTEIGLRKFGRKLKDLKRSVNFEDQKPISDIGPEIQQMRDELMRKMWKQ